MAKLKGTMQKYLLELNIIIIVVSIQKSYQIVQRRELCREKDAFGPHPSKAHSSLSRRCAYDVASSGRLTIPSVFSIYKSAFLKEDFEN